MGASKSLTNALTDRLLRSWVRCRRRAWLDRHGDPKQRVWTAHRTLQLDDQQRSFVALLPHKPGHGLEACRQGQPGVVGLRLKHQGLRGHSFESHPPLLQRVEGRSCWGPFAYRPVMARHGRRLTREHRLALAFAGRLLEPLQGSDVLEGLVVAGSGRSLVLETVQLNHALQSQLSDVLQTLSNDLQQSDPPALVADRRKCALCSWRGLCNEVASQEGHLSEVSGIGARRLEMLNELGIHGLDDLAASDPEDLGQRLVRFGEQHREVASELVAQARAQRDHCVESLKVEPSLPELFNVPGVLIYDIESDPDARDDFLHGFVRLRRRMNGVWDLEGATYQPLLTLVEHGEAKAWKRLRSFLGRYPDWPILHYGETESLTLRRMAKRQGASDAEIKELASRMIDVHCRLRSHWRLPLNSYRLKAVADWLGFRWRRPGADGARALLWWRQWQGSGPGWRGSSNNLRWIFEYNHDDCLATWIVVAWLLQKDLLLEEPHKVVKNFVEGLPQAKVLPSGLQPSSRVQ